MQRTSEHIYNPFLELRGLPKLSKLLKRVLSQEDAVIFVGSGISRWSGLPSWERLIVELADYLDENDAGSDLVRQEAKTGELLQAASYGFSKLTPNQIALFVRRACKTGIARPHQIHGAILSLGPSCFITTNYDDLIEQAYRQYLPSLPEPRVVINTHLLEQAEIIHAQAREFIFKPHGDARHSDSIILTREQYRKLLPDGSLSATLNTFKTILQSRPVIFIGFGLRDPDFILVRDVLANIYRGGMRDHYAIVADPISDQIDYWKTNYGIHLIGYKTADEGKDHSNLIKLLESLKMNQIKIGTQDKFDIESPASILAIARYAAGSLKNIPADRFEINAEEDFSNKTPLGFHDPYNYIPVKTLLNASPKRLLILGEPGSGKSFAIHEVANDLASTLQDACLQGTLERSMRLPITIDLRLYDGNLFQQIETKFNDKLSLSALYKIFPVTIYLDGYNEIPREFKEGEIFESQLLSLIETFPEITLVIGSRMADGLESFGFQAYRLSNVSRKEVETRIVKSNISLPTSFRNEIIDILQRPFYFNLFSKLSMLSSNIHNPSDLYEKFVDRLYKRFIEKFDSSIDLLSALRQLAYTCLEKGDEAFQLIDLTNALNRANPDVNPDKIDEIANWLVSADLIIPIRGRRAAFVHQSITEYLAACELSLLIEHSTDNVTDLIMLRRWDNAIFLTMTLLSDANAESLLKNILHTDIEFAFRAARYIEHNSENILNMLLKSILKMTDLRYSLAAKYNFQHLPFSLAHENRLREIARSLSSLRGEAYIAMAQVVGKTIKYELLDALFSETSINEAYDIGRALSLVLENNDLLIVFDRTLKLDPSSIDDDSGETWCVIRAISTSIQNLDIDFITDVFRTRLITLSGDELTIASRLICRFHGEKKSPTSLSIVMDIIKRRLVRTTFDLYISVAYNESMMKEFIDNSDHDVIDAIIDYAKIGDQWSFELLRIQKLSCIFGRKLTMVSKDCPGALGKLFSYCIHHDEDVLFSALNEWADAGCQREEGKILELVDFQDLNWSGRHELLYKLLSLRNLEVTKMILGGRNPPDFHGLQHINLGDAKPWIKWLVNINEQNKDGNSRKIGWITIQMTTLIARSSAADNKITILDLFEKGSSSEKSLIGKSILLQIPGLTMSDFSRESIETLKQLLAEGSFGTHLQAHVFSKIADEEFLKKEIFPLYNSGAISRNTVDTIAQQIGRRLRIRIKLP